MCACCRGLTLDDDLWWAAITSGRGVWEWDRGGRPTNQRAPLYPAGRLHPPNTPLRAPGPSMPASGSLGVVRCACTTSAARRVAVSPERPRRATAAAGRSLSCSWHSNEPVTQPRVPECPPASFLTGSIPTLAAASPAPRVAAAKLAGQPLVLGKRRHGLVILSHHHHSQSITSVHIHHSQPPIF